MNLFSAQRTTLRNLFCMTFLAISPNAVFASEVNDDARILQEVDKLLSSESKNSLPASVSLDYGWDSETGRNYYTNLDFPVFEKRLLLSGGKNTSLNSETNEEESSTSYSIGIFNDGRDTLGLGVEYRSWNFENIVEINSLRGTIELNFPDVVFSLTPQFRNISYTDTVTFLNNSRELDIHIDSSGYNTSLIIYMPADIWVSGAYAAHQYNDEIFAFNSRRSFFEIAAQQNSIVRLSPVVLDNTYGLEKNRSSADIGVDFKQTGISIGWSESVSAVDEESSTTTNGKIYWRMDKHWQISLSGGVQSNSINSDKTSYGVLSARYRF